MLKRLSFYLFIAFILSTNFVNAQSAPHFNNPGPVSLCINGSYYLNPSSTDGTFSTNDPLIATVNASGYVTGVSAGSTIVSLVISGVGTVSATINVVASLSPSLTITDPTALANYKFDNNPHGPIGGTINYVGYKDFNYSSQARPSNTGYYRSTRQDGNNAGCPTEYYIIKCDACSGTVSQYSTRPQGTLTGNAITQSQATGQLTYTSSNGGGPFTIIYQATGGSPVTANNISSTVAFNVITPTITTTYKLINVTDANTHSSSDFTGTTATITVTHYVGESYGGGIVFYVSDGGAHGLIAATVNQSTSIQWYNGTSTTTTATGTTIGSGRANTNAIIAAQGPTETSYAAGLARAYRGGGYADWYLPSKDELYAMYTKIGQGNFLNVAPLPNTNIGNFAFANYWSSSEGGLGLAWTKSFNGGSEDNFRKDATFHIRAIRSF